MLPAPLRLTVAINPNASFGRRRDVGPRVAERLAEAGHQVAMLREPNLELLRREAEDAVAHGTDALIVVGGDGMVSLGANLVAGTATPLGIVASGTGNDMARALGLPIDDAEAGIDVLLAALQREPRVIDAARVRHGGLTTWFCGALSAGFDARVNERANRMTRPRGPSRYTIAMVRELMSFKPIRYSLVVDGVAREVSAMLIAVSNGVSIGGGMKITPDAELDDGELDLLIVSALSKPRFLKLFPRVFAGEHVSEPEVEITRVRTVSLAAADVVAYADGERVGPLPLDVEVVPGALRMLV
ncbi:diacylglycerol/lipid kinase family protein [Microterricola viridarii]|uniref:Diacylglycerol kinase n=1 Tax=Microterricola viridarii TaxID=412690 RepID=A0A1H1SMT8_9MICO|nr:diacylglycerol kinase family protein [Microterricola viridarii]SDS49221.1 diacylglycerol kinase [Microterricola viridarii]